MPAFGKSHCVKFAGVIVVAGILGFSFSKFVMFPQETVLFLGDSITEEGGFVREIETALKQRSNDHPIRVINRGKSSETISGLSEARYPGDRPCLLTRLEHELIKFRPDWVVACYGMNCGVYQPLDERRFAAYRQGVETLIEKVNAAGGRLVLLTPPPYAQVESIYLDHEDHESRRQRLDQANCEALNALKIDAELYGYRAVYPYYDDVLDAYSRWIKSLDQRDNIWVVDVRSAMLPRMTECYGEDPIHPNETGHHIMADIFLQSWPEIIEEAKLIDGSRKLKEKESVPELK